VDARHREAKPNAGSPVVSRVQSWWRSKIVRWLGSKHSAALSYRYLARQIAADLPYAEGGRAILISGPGALDLINETLLLFAYYARDELGCRTLLVDATFTREGVTAPLGYADAPGFAELLYASENRLTELIQPTERPGIAVLPAGRPPQNTLSPLQVAKAAAIFDEARRGFDYVLLQQASILTDSRYLLFTGFADLLLLVVEEGGTPLDEIERCKRLFHDHQISNARLLLAASR
jgi:tyrosine-protein kinase Etk/Wzc